ncbi:Clavaminate synthase-like protein [Viridothelium virens]|uniref:Clavaminate synthase-like protein n=1 Tax=Viridothelium virens TaxID=1048519 RepID=A0A6A6H6C3_VIRVR|nr:Clavaminate synthase-like protein [Viridothelium virens]
MPSILPPYPEHLSPEAPLTRISLSSLLAHDHTIEAALISICQSHGFFYLDLTTHPQGQHLLTTASTLLTLAETAFRLPQPTKDALTFDRTDSLFGYKAGGKIAQTDPHRRQDRAEFWNVSKDDLLANRGCRAVAYPDAIWARKTELRTFVETAHAVGMRVLEVLARRVLGVEAGVLEARHRIGELSGDHVRMTWAPGEEEGVGAGAEDEEAEPRPTTAPHTDFGSVTLLFNWAGGLQIESQESKKWEWVRPLLGHAICNLGDAMVEFSGGRVMSGKHRVVAAPGEQVKSERYSLVYFVRPEDEVYLEDLTQSTVNKSGTNGVEYVKAKDWIMKRAELLGNEMDKPMESKKSGQSPFG